MPKLERVVIVNRDTQTSDLAVYKKDLPTAGCFSALDIGVRVTNGGTSNVNGDILNGIKHIGLVFNGNQYRVWVTGQELFRINWYKQGQPMPYNFSEILSEVQEVWFRIPFGRFLGDTVYGLDLSRFNNVQVQIDYGLASINAVGATGPLTGTFAPTIIGHAFPAAQRPSFRSMIGLREFYTATSVASGENVQSFPSQNPLANYYGFCLVNNVAEGTDVTDVRIGFDMFARTVLNDKWYNLQTYANAVLDERTVIVKILLADAQTRDLPVSNIKCAVANEVTWTVPT